MATRSLLFGIGDDYWQDFTVDEETYFMYQVSSDTDFDKYCEDASILFGKTGIQSAFEALEG